MTQHKDRYHCIGFLTLHKVHNRKASSVANHQLLLNKPFHATFCCRRLGRVSGLQASISRTDMEQSNSSMKQDPFEKLKTVLEETKQLGKLRLIATNEATVMESICTTEKLFYAQGGPNNALYANLIDTAINLDLHLKLEAIGGIRFEQGVSRTLSKSPTYIIRWLARDLKTVILSMFLQWDKDPSDISPQRIEHWNALKEKYTKDREIHAF